MSEEQKAHVEALFAAYSAAFDAFRSAHPAPESSMWAMGLDGKLYAMPAPTPEDED